MATYEVIRKLGEGSHGILYEAEQVELKRRVAMKRLRPELRGRARMVERFAREAQVCGRLNHPNVVSVHDSGVDESGPFIAFELLHGETLLDLGRREAPLPPSVVLDIVDETLLGLGSAHACGIVHRDIKPANIFLCVRPDGSTTVKLLDFGIAKTPSRESLTGLTNPGDVVGSFAFMAVEQLLQKEVDGRADLYSVGVCMYMLLSGVKPFDASSVQDLILQLNQKPTPLIRRVPSLSPELSATVQRALEREPNDRFASAEEMRVALAACRGNSRAVWGRSTLTDITIRESALDSPAPFDVPTAVPPEDGITEPREVPIQRSRLAAPSEAETMPRAISTRLIALSVEAFARDPLTEVPPLEPLERTARMAAPVVPGQSSASFNASAKAPSVLPDPRADLLMPHLHATRNVAVTPSAALPQVTPQPPPSGRDLSPPSSAPSVIVASSPSSNRIPLVAGNLPSKADTRNAETAPALRLGQLRREDLELERALGNYRRKDRTRTVVFVVVGLIAGLSLVAAAYLYAV
jgi:serine/threonine protein kinase